MKGVQSGELDSVDFAFSFSSWEHDGLGRYGDPIDPWGDIKAVQRASCYVKPGENVPASLPRVHLLLIPAIQHTANTFMFGHMLRRRPPFFCWSVIQCRPDYVQCTQNIWPGSHPHALSQLEDTGSVWSWGSRHHMWDGHMPRPVSALGEHGSREELQFSAHCCDAEPSHNAMCRQPGLSPEPIVCNCDDYTLIYSKGWLGTPYARVEEIPSPYALCVQ